MKNMNLQTILNIFLVITIAILFYLLMTPKNNMSIIKKIPVFSEINNLNKNNYSLSLDIKEKEDEIRKFKSEQEKIISEKIELENELLELNEQIIINGYKMKLIKDKGYGVVDESNSIMQSMAVDLINALINEDGQKIKVLCTDEIYKKFENSKDLTNNVTEEQILFRGLKGKKLTSFSHITYPFANGDKYTLAIYFYCENFNDSKLVNVVIDFYNYNGIVRISGFGQDV